MQSFLSLLAFVSLIAAQFVVVIAVQEMYADTQPSMGPRFPARDNEAGRSSGKTLWESGVGRDELSRVCTAAELIASH